MVWRRIRNKLGQESSLVAVDDWTPLVLQGGITAVGFTPEPAWYKDPFGVVHLRGYLQGGTGTQFTLPVGARPVASELFGTVLITAAGGATSTVTPCTVSGVSFRPSD